MSTHEERLQKIESRLLKIERALNIPATEPAAAQKPVDKWNEPTTATLSTIVELKQGNWLGIIGILCFIFAAGFIIKLSIDSGWLTPVRQLGLALLFGISLIAAGFLFMKSDRAYASLLPAAGVIILFATGFAAHQYYSIISFETAILFTSLVSILCVYLFLKIRHDVYAIAAAMGAYIAPIILELNATSTFTLYYFLACSLVFAVISIWIQNRIFIILAAYLAILVNAYIGFNLNQDSLMAILLPVHFLIFTIGSYIYTLQTNKELTNREAWSFFPVLSIFYAMEYYFIERINSTLAPYLSLLFAGLLLAIYLGAKQYYPKKHFNSWPMILAFTTLVLFHSIYLELLPDHFKPWLFVIIFFSFAFIPQTFFTKKAENQIQYKIPMLAILAILAIEYIDMLTHLIDNYNFSYILVSLFAVASIWFFLINKEINFRDNLNNLLLIAAHLLAVTAFYQLTTNHGSLAVSASWLLYASAVMIFAFFRKDKVMAKSALFVLAFAAGKALLYDVSSAPTIVRILCLLFTGAVLYGAGFMMRKISEWKK